MIPRYMLLKGLLSLPRYPVGRAATSIAQSLAGRRIPFCPRVEKNGPVQPDDVVSVGAAGWVPKIISHPGTRRPTEVGCRRPLRKQDGLNDRCAIIGVGFLVSESNIPPSSIAF
jgi:hypothetical protein